MKHVTRRSFQKALLAQGLQAARRPLRIGIGAYTYHNLSIDAMIAEMQALRITEMEMSRGEFMTFKHPPIEMFESFRKKIDVAGIRCVSYYAPTIKTQKDLDDSIRFAKALGATNITGDPEGDVLRLVDERVSREGMTFGIHNHFFANRKFTYETPDDILNALRGRSKAMGCTLDIGHIISCGHDPIEAVKKLGPHLKLFHLKDIQAPGAEVNVPLGTGLCKIAEVMGLLRKMSFTGLIAFEYEKEGDINEDVARQIAWARKHV